MNDTLAGASPVDQPVRPRRADVVPGVMHCARCKFRLQRVNLYVNVGAVGAGDNDTEPCPNGCGPLWPVTWEQEAREGYKLAEDLFDRAKRAEDVLRDLVALEDMRLRLRSLHERGHGTDYEHYHEGLPKAWDAARAVLLTPNVRANRPSGAATGVAMTDKVAGPDGSVLSEGLGPNAQTVERWYCVSREGMATLCVDEEDARANAAHCDQAWRAGSPHRAVRLVDAPRWVPVSEALPPEHVTCAVRMQGDYIATAWAAYWHGARTDFGRWVFPHDSDEDCADKITHWLALPTVAGLGA